MLTACLLHANIVSMTQFSPGIDTFTVAAAFKSYRLAVFALCHSSDMQIMLIHTSATAEQ